MKRFWAKLDIKLDMIFCLNNFLHKYFQSWNIAKNMEKMKKIIYLNIYQCLIINKDNHMNQHSKYEKILSSTWYKTGHDLLP